MKKVAILLVVTTVACTTVLSQIPQGLETTGIEPEPVEIYSTKVRQKAATYRCFREALESTLLSLTHGESSLTDAVSRIHDAAELWWPPYLKGCARYEVGQTLTEQIARNLLGHLQNAAEMNPVLNCRMPMLREELNSLISEMEKSKRGAEDTDPHQWGD